MKSLDEFTRSGGRLTGGSHNTHEEYEGAPRQYNEKLSTSFEKLGLADGGTGAASADDPIAGVGGATHHRRQGSNGSSSSSSSAKSVEGTRRKEEDRLPRKTGDAGGVTGAAAPGTTSGQAGKPSLMDRLNPRKDADGDGKAGIGD
jgi:hypothetical protein